jgi:hypothetical protein
MGWDGIFQYFGIGAWEYNSIVLLFFCVQKTKVQICMKSANPRLTCMTSSLSELGADSDVIQIPYERDLSLR